MFDIATDLMQPKQMLVENMGHILLHIGHWAILCMSGDQHTHISREVRDRECDRKTERIFMHSTYIFTRISKVVL